MAFTFKVEDGTGYMDSNSYVSVEDADDIILLSTSSAVVEWSGKDPNEKEILLASASKYLDNRFQWNGDMSSETQAMRWPRKGTKTRDGLAVGLDEIPDNLKEAVAEMALVIMRGDPASDSKLNKVKEIDAGEVRIEFAGSNIASSIPVNIEHILRGLGVSMTSRRQAKKIVRS